uniref:Uncharacterized protein n=1 Tax=Rhizophora mucronata TaxID=61149 RepID=A0A2P2JV51_RHIMU
MDKESKKSLFERVLNNFESIEQL